MARRVLDKLGYLNDKYDGLIGDIDEALKQNSLLRADTEHFKLVGAVGTVYVCCVCFVVVCECSHHASHAHTL